MGSMDHDNVVRLYCVCMSKQLMLVSQYVPLGALVDYLKRHKDNLSAVGILQFSSQIALVSEGEREGFFSRKKPRQQCCSSVMPGIVIHCR